MQVTALLTGERQLRDFSGEVPTQQVSKSLSRRRLPRPSRTKEPRDFPNVSPPSATRICPLPVDLPSEEAPPGSQKQQHSTVRSSVPLHHSLSSSSPVEGLGAGGRAAPAHGRSRDPRGCRSSAVGNRGAQLLSSQQCPLLIHPRLVRSPGGSFGLRQTGGHELSCGSGHGTNRTGRVCFSVPWRSRRHPEGLSCSVLRRKRGGGGDQDW